MLKWLIRVNIVLVLILAVVAGRGLFFYSGFYHAPQIKMPDYEQITAQVTPPITQFSDNYTQGKGNVLIDVSHYNYFNEGELNILILRLISRGMTVNFFRGSDDLEKQLLGEEEDMSGGKLLPADAFIIVCPRSQFSKEDIEITDNFTSKGGKLLLIEDPTRSADNMNSLSIKFDLIFEPDYLYNMQENESNYRNIFITDFEENKITRDLKKIALYTAGSISSVDDGIAFVGENTFSSVIELREKLSPMVMTQESRVLAIYDLTFMTEPYNGILDNNQLISNIADWLASPTK
ncbi:hypothetical protein ACFLVH_03995 [Chloroflexota bacterium]